MCCRKVQGHSPLAFCESPQEANETNGTLVREEKKKVPNQDTDNHTQHGLHRSFQQITNKHGETVHPNRSQNGNLSLSATEQQEGYP